VFLRSKVKVSEWRNFGVERVLGAANGDEPKRRIHEIKNQSREGEERAARGKEVVCYCKILAVEEQRERKRRPTRNPDTWGTQIRLPDLRPGHPPSALSPTSS
jgi:hypothetical protein